MLKKVFLFWGVFACLCVGSLQTADTEHDDLNILSEGSPLVSIELSETEAEVIRDSYSSSFDEQRLAVGDGKVVEVTEEENARTNCCVRVFSTYKLLAHSVIFTVYLFGLGIPSTICYLTGSPVASTALFIILMAVTFVQTVAYFLS